MSNQILPICFLLLQPLDFLPAKRLNSLLLSILYPSMFLEFLLKIHIIFMIVILIKLYYYALLKDKNKQNFNFPN